jgi:hypothetical protein
MRGVSRLVFDIILSGGSVRMVSSDVRLAILDTRGVPVRLMTMGRMSISVCRNSDDGGRLRGVCTCRG